MDELIATLSRLTAAETPQERAQAQAYLLLPSYALRVFAQRGLCLVALKSGRAVPMTELELTAARLCCGEIDLNCFAVTPAVRRAAEHLVKRGLARPCRSDERLLPEQALTETELPYIEGVKWALTGRCNLRCKHCFLSAPEAALGELSHEVCMRLIGEMAQCGVRRVALTGGEPLVREDFLTLCAELTRQGIRISSIATNGVLVTPALLDRLEELNLHPTFYMSFDGVNWHDWLRGVQGLERQLMQRFELLAARGYRTGSAMSLHRHNLPVLRQSVNRLASVGCRHVIVNRMTQFGEWAKYGRDASLGAQECYDAFLAYLPQFYADGAPVRLVLNRFFQTTAAENPDYELLPIARCNGQALCAATRELPYLAADGKLMPCLNVAVQQPACLKMPDCTHVGFRQALCDAGYRAATDLTREALHRKHPQCASCPHKTLCGGGCRATALAQQPDDYLAPDPDNCMFFREQYPQRILDTVAAACPEARCLNYPNDC